MVVGALLAVGGVFSGGGGSGGGGGGGTKAEFTAFPVHADVIDLDARADKVAFITPAKSGNGKEIRRLDLGGGPPETVTQVAPKYEGVDVGSDGSDHARLVYSSCDAANVCQLFRKPFTDVAKPVPVSRPGCSDARPSMWKDMILFARKGPACDQPGLWLKPAGSAPLEKVTGANGGADLNNGRLVWFVPGRGLFAKDVDTSGKLSPAGAREPPAGEAFIPPIVVDGDYAYFVHEQGGKDFIARAALPFDKSPIEHYVAGPEDVGADEAPHFGVTGGILYITNYPRPNGDPGSRMVLRVRNPVFERAE